jgi:DegV family protein with EDD domain
MKIRYLNGRRLYYAFLAGGNAVIQDKDYLNRINVFPVPDSDTGTNLASTLHSIAQSARHGHSVRETMRSIADAALMGARGNSGLIFAQFVQGFTQEISVDSKMSTMAFGDYSRRAIQHVYRSILSPVEGTMITVMKDWAEAIYRYRTKTADFVELLSHSLQAARQSLRDTPKRLQVLARAGVVDAGAKGFVDFIEGVIDFVRAGKLRHIIRASRTALPLLQAPKHSLKNGLTHRYCAEALLVGRRMDLERLRTRLSDFGESVIVAGSPEKLRFHIHTNDPAALFGRIEGLGSTRQIKVDDMRRQYDASHRRKHPIALVTDSACDLPQDELDKNQVHVVPFNLNFGHDIFLDRLTIQPAQFYERLSSRPEHPTTGLPAPTSVQNLLSFLTSFYDSILVYHISSNLSGTYKATKAIAEGFMGKKISVIDTKTLSLSQGLLVLRAAEAIGRGLGHDEIVRASEEWVRKSRLLVDVATMKYFIRGGRVSPVKGLLARVLHIKPVITLDETGKAADIGKVFTRKASMAKILKAVADWSQEQKIWKYAVVHARNKARADEYAARLTEVVGFAPAYVQEITPVIGVHAGPGTVGITLLFK